MTLNSFPLHAGWGRSFPAPSAGDANYLAFSRQRRLLGLLDDSSIIGGAWILSGGWDGVERTAVVG